MDLQHNPQQQTFYCLIDGLEAHVNYRKVDEHTLNMYHTYVPPALRHQGIARALVREAAEYAKQHGFAVIPSCSYVAAFFRRTPEYADLVEHW